MKKTLGLGITALGILMIVAGFLFTPAHTLNPFDSNNGTNSAPGLVYGGFIVFGIGLVIYTATIAYYGTKDRNLNSK
jgi:hypothetical protein